MQTQTVKFDITNEGGGLFLMRCNGGLSWEDRDTLAASVEDHTAEVSDFRALVVDFARTQYVNSAGLGALFQLVRRLRPREARLAFASVPPTLGRLFQTVGLDRVTEFFESTESALASLQRSAPAALRDTRPQPPATPLRTSFAPIES